LWLIGIGEVALSSESGTIHMEIQTGEQVLELMRGFQVSCVVAAAADLGVLSLLAESPLTADQTAGRLACDPRAMAILLDALAGLGLLTKAGGRYAVPPALRLFVAESSPQSVDAMLRHQANCLRRWARLPWVVKTGVAADAGTSLRGEAADRAAFIEAMDVINRDAADSLVREINPGGFRCVLDVGGGSGTWTLAWLRAAPAARAILFDLPPVIPLADERLERSGLADRVQLVAGDFYTDPLPRGADLAWVSAIIHQNSREENRALFRRIAEALDAGGWILIRDIVMDESRTAPVSGVLFAVNMLVATASGNTYTLAEIAEDLAAAGFSDVQQVRHDQWMHSVVRARSPKRHPEG
jgi:SAM-dependent methyltransferase